MVLTPTRCFLVERVNERKRRVRAKWCCPPSKRGPDCTREPGYTEVLFDIHRPDTGEVLATGVHWLLQADLPPGAMGFSSMTERHRPVSADDWSSYTKDEIKRVRKNFREHPEWYRGPSPSNPRMPACPPSHLFADGPQLYVRLPNDGGWWNVDSRANNCTLPYDYVHRCWQRTGTPPLVTAGKSQPTCSAGGGSIATPGYHGFLQNGFLTDHLG